MSWSNGENPVRELARWHNPDICTERSPMCLMAGCFNYIGSSLQGLGWCIDMEFVGRFCRVFGVDSLQKTDGRYCFVTHVHDNISKIEPTGLEDSKYCEEFDIIAWSEKIKEVEE